MIINMWLKPARSTGDHQSLIVETFGGQVYNIRPEAIYEIKQFGGRFKTNRTDIRFGTLKYIYILQNSTYFIDLEILTAVLEKATIDTKHFSKDFLFDQTFTWEQSEYMKLKKRKDLHIRKYEANLKTFNRMLNWRDFTRNRKQGSMIKTTKQLDVKLYEKF